MTADGGDAADRGNENVRGRDVAMQRLYAAQPTEPECRSGDINRTVRGRDVAMQRLYAAQPTEPECRSGDINRTVRGRDVAMQRLYGRGYRNNHRSYRVQ